MSLRLKKVDSARSARKAIEEKEFNDIIIIPDDSDSESIELFVNLKRVDYDPKTLTEISDVLDGDGQCVFDINYCIDTEAALRAGIQRVKFEVFTKNPQPIVFPAVGSGTGTRLSINSAVLSAMGAYGKSVKGPGLGPMVSIQKTTSVSAAYKTDRSSTKELDRGLVAEFEVPTGVSGTNRQLFLDAIRGASLTSRFINSPVRGADLGQAATVAISSLSQTYVALTAPNVKIDSPAVSSGQVGGAPLGARANSFDRRISESPTSNFQETTQALGIQALLSGRDPVAHMNMYYGTGPTSSGGSTREPIRYDGSSTLQNEIAVSRAGRSADNGFVSTRPSGVQALTTQRAPNFQGNSAQELLYRKSGTVSLASSKGSIVPNIPIQQVSFKSALKQFKSEFDVSLLTLRPKVNRDIWVTVSLQGSDGSSYKSRTYKIDIRKQLKSYLTPSLPPTLRVLSQDEGKVELEIEQRDPVATDVSIFRMVARPEDLGESVWARVTDIRANSRRGTVKFTDETITANVSPNIVLYEARCSGPFGSICPITSRVVEAGVKKITNLTRSKNQGVCNIVAAQVGNKIEIRVSRLPPGVTRVFLRKQLANSSLRERDFRKSLIVPVQGGDSDFYDAVDSDGVYIFEDSGVINRQVYRYFAQYDWVDRERTNSVTEEFIEYRKVPDRPIISYLDGVRTGVDDLGQSFVSFELGATFADAGLEELNRILGDTGVSSLFVDELKKDRSLISNLLLFQVTRRNTRSGESVVWPLIREGTFIDSAESRASARGSTGATADSALSAGAQYLYTARLNIVNPERFFKEALTRIPASTRQIIVNTDPNFVQVSSAKFAENFAIQPGTIQSPTTVEKETKFSEGVQGAYTGISYTQIVDIPLFKAKPKSVKVVRSGLGRPANIIKWKIEGSIESVYSFEVRVILGRENSFPLCSVSPTISEDGQYELRDELYVKEISPVTYVVSVVYTDMSKSEEVRSNEVYAGTLIPVAVLDQAIRRQVIERPGFDLSRLNPQSLEARQIVSRVDPLVVGPLVDPRLSGNNLTNQIVSNRSNLLSPEGQNLLKTNNPLRKLRGS